MYAPLRDDVDGLVSEESRQAFASLVAANP
jgi:hypothetical protein